MTAANESGDRKTLILGSSGKTATGGVPENKKTRNNSRVKKPRIDTDRDAKQVELPLSLHGRDPAVAG
jgi:hypothetical protein